MRTLNVRQKQLVAEIEKRGYRVVFRPYVEDAQTPGFLGQIAGRTSHEAREVVIGTAGKSNRLIVATLIHELLHVEDPAWDCGSRSPVS